MIILFPIDDPVARKRECYVEQFSGMEGA